MNQNIMFIVSDLSCMYCIYYIRSKYDSHTFLGGYDGLAFGTLGSAAAFTLYMAGTVESSKSLSYVGP